MVESTDPLFRQSLSREAALSCDVKFICNRGKVAVYAHSMVLNKGANSDGLRQMIETARIENNKKIIPLGSGSVLKSYQSLEITSNKWMDRLKSKT